MDHSLLRQTVKAALIFLVSLTLWICMFTYIYIYIYSIYICMHLANGYSPFNTLILYIMYNGRGEYRSELMVYLSTLEGIVQNGT